MAAIVGGVLTLLASFLFYLASPNRKIARHWQQEPMFKIIGALGLIIGLGCILTWSGTATSVFIALTLIMLILTLAPLGIAWWLGAGAKENTGDKE